MPFHTVLSFTSSGLNRSCRLYSSFVSSVMSFLLFLHTSRASRVYFVPSTLQSRATTRPVEGVEDVEGFLQKKRYLLPLFPYQFFTPRRLDALDATEFTFPDIDTRR